MRWAREADFDVLIAAQAQRSGIDVAVVKAIIGQESRFDPSAYHYDADYETRHQLPPDPALDASYGLMQVEGRTARATGFSGDLSGLYDPATNLAYGVPLLADLLNRYGGDVARAASAYNGGDRPELGFGTAFSSGQFGNQGYVDAVLDNVTYFRAQAAQNPDLATTTPAPSAGRTLTVVILIVAVLAVLATIAVSLK